MLLDNGKHLAYTRLLFKASAQESRRYVRPAGSPVVLVLPLPKADNTQAMFGEWARHSQSNTSISQDLLDLFVSRGPLVLLRNDVNATATARKKMTPQRPEQRSEVPEH